jgi:hypothetical protein
VLRDCPSQPFNQAALAPYPLPPLLPFAVAHGLCPFPGRLIDPDSQRVQQLYTRQMVCILIGGFGPLLVYVTST